MVNWLVWVKQLYWCEFLLGDYSIKGGFIDSDEKLFVVMLIGLFLVIVVIMVIFVVNCLKVFCNV